MPGLLWSRILNSGVRQFRSLPYFCVGEPFDFCSPLHLPAVTCVVGLAAFQSVRVTGQAQTLGTVLPPSECVGLSWAPVATRCLWWGRQKAGDPPSQQRNQPTCRAAPVLSPGVGHWPCYFSGHAAGSF